MDRIGLAMPSEPAPQSPRVELSALSQSDSQPLYDQMKDRAFRLDSGSFHFVHQHAHEQWFEKVRNAPDGVTLAVRRLNSLEPIGLAQLLDVHPVHRHAELRIKLIPTEQGKGFGGQAVRLLCAHGFGDLNLTRIYLYVMAHNTRAIALYRRSGFVEEGRLRSHIYADGAYRDLLVLGLMKDEWRP